MKTETRNNIRFHLVDCIEFMKTKPDNFWNLAICDPPYGINISKKTTIGKRGSTYSTTIYKSKEWDSCTPNENYFNELFRVSKNQIIFGANYFSNYLPASMGWFVYDKRQPEGFSMAQAELAYTSFNRSIRMKGFKRSEVQNCVSNNKKIALANAKIHHCQKPIPLYRWIIQNYATKGQMILDTHGGSFTHAIACDMEGFELDICEIDEEYFNNGLKAFDKYKSQITLF